MQNSKDILTQANIGTYVNNLVARSRAVAPKSIFNTPVVILHTVFGLILSPLVLLQFITTSALCCITSLTFGLPLYIMDIIWWPLIGFMLASSWLWYHLPFLRIILLLPGVLIAEIASHYVGLMPSMGEWDSRATKIALCDSWPHSLNVFKLHKLDLAEG